MSNFVDFLWNPLETAKYRLDGIPPQSGKVYLQTSSRNPFLAIHTHQTTVVAITKATVDVFQNETLKNTFNFDDLGLAILACDFSVRSNTGYIFAILTDDSKVTVYKTNGLVTLASIDCRH